MIPVAEPFIEGSEEKYIIDVLKSGWVSTGKYVELFEQEFAKFVGSKYAVSVCNGTCGLHLALKACDVNFYNNIILPNYTFVATAEAAKYCTDNLTFINPDKTWNMNVNKIELKDTTAAIIPVHLYGTPCDMNKIMEIKKNNPNVKIIEDACESLGAYYNDKHVGTIGDIGVFSLYGNKQITSGEGGMCVTDDEELYNKMKKLRHHGESDVRYHHDEVGFNYRMSNLNAALGLAQLRNINEILTRKANIKDVYDNMFKQIKDIKLQNSYKESKPVNWLYTIEFKDAKICKKVVDKLKENDIDTRQMFRPMNSMKPYGNEILKPNNLCFRVINLPSSPNLTTYEQIKIVTLIEEVLKSGK